MNCYLLKNNLLLAANNMFQISNSYILLSAQENMHEFGGSDYFVLLIVALIFALGVYTLLKFRKNKDF